MKHLSILGIIFVASSQFFCHKVETNSRVPPALRATLLISRTWGLISATSLPDVSTGTLHNYRGTQADSLNFTFSLDPNLGNYGILSSIRGVTNLVSVDTILLAPNVPATDTSDIAFDKYVLSASWMPSYGDTIFVSKASQSTLVFQVNYSDSLGKGVEVDSFTSIRLHD